MNMVKICFISYNLFSNKGGILEYLYSCMRFADRCGMLSLIACFLSSKWTCFRNMLDNQCGKRLLYFIETIFWDKLDNCFISYSPCTSIATGRYLIVFIDFPQIWKSTDEYGKTPFCVWLIYVPGMVFYIFFSPTSRPAKRYIPLGKTWIWCIRYLFFGCLITLNWIRMNQFSCHFWDWLSLSNCEKTMGCSEYGSWGPFFSSPKLNHCAQSNSLSIRSTCFLDGERYYCDNAYVGDIVTSFLCRYGLSNHLVTSLLEVFCTRC